MAFCRRHHLELSKVELFSFLIANQMQFEAKEPSHGAFASLGNTLEYFMDTYPLIPTYSQRSVVQETYAGAFPKQHFLMNSARGIAISFPSSTKRLYETTFGKRCRRCLQTFSK